MTSFKTDENLPEDIAQLVRKSGFDACTVVDQSPGGESDRLISVVCRSEGRTHITLDLDFADIRSCPPVNSPGMIILRPATHTIRNVIRLTEHVLATLPRDPKAGRLWIVDDKQIRIRG